MEFPHARDVIYTSGAILFSERERIVKMMIKSLFMINKSG